MGRCTAQSHAAQRKGISARPIARETQRWLRASLACRPERRQSASRQTCFLRLWLVPRSLSRALAHVAHRKHHGISHGDRALHRRRWFDCNYSVQPHRSRARKIGSSSCGYFLLCQKLICTWPQNFASAQDNPASLPSPFTFARAAIAPYCFIIVRICRYCLRTVLTSCTVVPLPLAMRLRLLPSITLWSRRSWLVIELMMASTRVSWPSSTFASLGRFCSGPIFGSMSTIFSRGPILRICFS